MRFLKYLIVILLILFVLGSFACRKPGGTEPIFLSGAGMKAPVMEIVADFEQRTGIAVQTHFEGSSILRNYISDFQTGDVFLPGDVKNLDLLEKQGLVQEKQFLAWHVVAILVSPQMKDRIKSLDDLAVKGVRLAISNPRLASLGRIVMSEIIEKHPKGEDILRNVVVYGSSSQDVLRLYRAGGIDAIIEWDVMAVTPEGAGLVVVPIEKPYAIQDQLFAGLLTTANDQETAQRFYSYLIEEGREVFRKNGYDVNPDR